MNFISKYNFLVLIIVFLMVLSCAKKDKRSQAEKDEAIIQQYISDNKLNPTATGSGLYYQIWTQGTGVQPNINNHVKVAYNGHLSNGNVFDQSQAAGVSFALNSVIQGWQEGIPYFKKGGKGILLIPSALGYGSQAQGSIPANTVLVFDIELIDVQ